MKAVERNGEVCIRDVPRAKKIRSAAYATVRHLDGTSVTKEELARAYGLSHKDATQLVHLMVAEGTLEEKGRGMSSWGPTYLVVAPQPPAPARASAPESAAERARRVKMEKLFSRYGRGKCDRCGGVMPGTSQRAKSKRGHTREVCDLSMVRGIQES